MKNNRVDSCRCFFTHIEWRSTYGAHRAWLFSEETGFCVLQVKAEGHRDLVTVVGSSPIVSAAEWLRAEGDRVVDKDHGRHRTLCQKMKAIRLTAI
jgi:hypothetical protein